MSGFQEFSFGEGDGHIGGRQKKFKAQEGQTYRVSFIWLNGLDTGTLDFGSEEAPGKPKFVGGQTHFLPNCGFVFNKGPEYTKLAGEAPKARIGTIIVVWPTDKSGKLDKARLANGEGEVLPWIFSGDKYRSLGQIHDEFPLVDHDITMSCSDAQYQKLTFTPCKENLLKALINKTDNPTAVTTVARLIGEAQQIASNLPNEIGKDWSLDQIREKMAGGGSPMASGGGGHSAAAAGGDIDNLVDGLLD